LTNVYLIRHGDYIDLEDGRYLADPGLSPEEVRQVELLRDRLAKTGEIKADLLIASPLRRAQESAEILAPVLGQSVGTDAELEEWRSDDGNLTPEEFTARWQQTPETQRPFFRWTKGCETWLEFSVRIQQALNRLCQEHEGKTMVLVSHGGVIQASFLYFFGLSATNTPGVSMENISITQWVKPENAQKWVLKRFNDNAHL
jgi:probable phosphoglycerate mutase